MKELIRRLKNDSRGLGTFMGLLSLGVLVLLFVSVIRISQSVTGADIDLQEGLADALKAACQQVEPRSEADGYPLVETQKAHEAFRYTLALNLNLDPVTLEARPNSIIKGIPNYSFVVYNGFDYYQDETYIGGPGGALDSTGAKAYTRFIFNNGVLARDDLPEPGFIPNLASNWPKTFDINDENGNKVFSVKLPNCGVVGVIDAEVNQILGKDPVKETRWASAVITWNGGACSIPPPPEPIIQ